MIDNEKLKQCIDELRNSFREFQEYKIQYDEAIENTAESLDIPKQVLRKVVNALEQRKTMILRTEADQVSELITELMRND